MSYTESRSRVLMMIAIAAVFVVVGAGLIWTDDPESGRGSRFFIAMLVASVLFFAASLVMFVPRLFREPRVIFVIDDDGFEDRTSPVSPGRVSWAEVTALAMMRMSGNNFVAVTVSDPGKLYRDRGPLVRFVARVNRYWADVTIFASTMPVPASEIFEQMHVRWTQSAAKQQSPGDSAHG